MSQAFRDELIKILANVADTEMEQIEEEEEEREEEASWDLAAAEAAGIAFCDIDDVPCAPRADSEIQPARPSRTMMATTPRKGSRRSGWSRATAACPRMEGTVRNIFSVEK